MPSSIKYNFVSEKKFVMHNKQYSKDVKPVVMTFN